MVRELRGRSRSTTIGVRDREGADIILLRLEGRGVEAVAARLNTTPKRVSMWSGRFERSGLDEFAGKPGRGRKASIAAAEKFWDVVGLYLNPPDQALVLCCDEKSQC